MKILTATLAGAAMLTLGASASAGNLVTNGGFTGTPGQINFGGSATGWTVAGGYAFVFAPGTADTTGSNGQYGNVPLWGPNNGSANGLPAASPFGGNFVALDGDFQDAPIQQTIGGLTAGHEYAVTFDYAFSQQYGFDGATVQSLAVSLGSQTQTTAPYDLPSHGFSGWMQQTFDFTATGPSEVLSFMANGNLPVPPFALLDGVSLEGVPEPGAWAPSRGCAAVTRLDPRPHSSDNSGVGHCGARIPRVKGSPHCARDRQCNRWPRTTISCP